MPRETLVLLPGMMCDERLFQPQIELFSRDYDVVVPGLPEPTIPAMAGAVLNQIAAKTFNLAGLSMGGIVAMEIINQAPERVDRLALLDTNHLADTPERRDLRNRQIEDVRSGKLRDVIVEEMKPNYLAMKNRSNRELLDTLIKMALELGAETFVAQSLALRDRKDSTDTLKTFANPAMVLCGKEDALCPPSRHREMLELLKDAEPIILPNTGHISTLESPDAVNIAMKNWLTRCTA